MALKWDKIKLLARAALDKRQLHEVYGKRLAFELAEIEKQGANAYWTEIISDPTKTFDSNPSNLLLPWLFGRVLADPIAGREHEVITTARYADVMRIISGRGSLPAEMKLDDDKPDIDIDCLPEARDEIKKHAIETYSSGIDDGYGAVCSVSTWMAYLFRSAILDVAKATEWVDKTEAMRLTKDLPDEVDDLKDNGASTCKGKKLDLEKGTEVDCKTVHAAAQCPVCGSTDTEGPTIGKLMKEYQVLAIFYATSPKHKDLIDYAVRLVGRIRAMGKHAGALIIADRPLYGNLPLYRRAKQGKKRVGGDDQWISIWTEGRNTQLSKFGYTKWDILGLKNLRYMYECCKMIEENHGISFGPGHGFGPGGGWTDIDPEDDDDELRACSVDACDRPGRVGHYYDAEGRKVKISLNDREAIRLANELRTDAVFQFDTDLAKRILSNGVAHFYDLMIFNAMGHPGPMAMIPDYVERRDDPKEEWRNEDDPRIAEVLGETYNTIVYQEQLQALWQALAGFTSPEAQEARKAVAKKWRDKLKPIKEKWITGASKTLGVEAAVAWWDKMETFGRYAFNRSHSVAYCLVAYRCLWLKAYYPHEWWAAVMGYCNPDKLVRYMSVARAEGVKFHTVNTRNLSTYFRAFVTPRARHDVGKSQGYIVPGLLGIKGAGKTAIAFAKPGEYDSIDAYIGVVGKHKILFERLIKLGAFRDLPGHENARATWIWYQCNYCTDTESKQLKAEIQSMLLKEQGWTEDAIVQERIRQEDEYRALYPRRKKIPKRISNFTPSVQLDLETISRMYRDDYILQDLLKFEEQFLGYTLHSPVDLFVTRGGRTIEQAKDNGELEAVIATVYKTKTRTGHPMCRLTVTDGIQTGTLILWHDQFILLDQAILRKGVGIRAFVEYDHERGSFTVRRNCPLIRLARKEDQQRAGQADVA